MTTLFAGPWTCLFSFSIRGLALVLVLLSDWHAPDAQTRTEAAVTPIERIVGTFSGPGVTCPQFRLESGETISLSGIYERDIPKNQPVELEGSWQLFSTCMQGREFKVTSLKPQD